MSLCPHGYTANLDCPVCPCACGSGRAAGECDCIAGEEPSMRLDVLADRLVHPIGCICETCSATYAREGRAP